MKKDNIQIDIFNFSPPSPGDSKYSEYQREVERCKTANAFWHRQGFGHPMRVCKWRAAGLSGYGLRLKHNGMGVPEAQHYNARFPEGMNCEYLKGGRVK